MRIYLGGNEAGEPIAIMSGNVAATQFQVRLVAPPQCRVFPQRSFPQRLR